VPSIQYGNWPDAVYHTSEDSPMFQDATQMKRAAFLAVTAGDILATAGPREAVAVAALTVGHAQERIGREVAAAAQSVALSGNAEELQTNYKEALNVVHQAYIREEGAISSAVALEGAGAPYPWATIAPMVKSFSFGETRDLEQIKLAYGAAAQELKVTPVENPPLSDAEKAAAQLYPQPKAGTPRQPQGFGGGGGGGGRNPAPPPLSGYYVMEARNFADGNHSLLEIRNALSAEFQPVPLENVEKFFHDLESQGWEIVEKKEPVPPAKGKRK
jgi:hypothetical protein